MADQPTEAQPNLSVTLSSEETFDVRQFSVHAELSDIFVVDLVAMSKAQTVDFEAIVGKAASFTMAVKQRADGADDVVDGGVDHLTYAGVCSEIQQMKSEESGLATYRIEIVPTLWLLKNRTNNRIFQYKNEIEIVLDVLKEWGVQVDLRLDPSAYKRRKYKVQYEESDFDFVNRMLEEVGVAYFFDNEGKVVLTDAPQKAERRKNPLTFSDSPNVGGNSNIEYATALQSRRRVGPGKVTTRDHDYRKPADYALTSSSQQGTDLEQGLELYDYVEGAFLYTQTEGGTTPTADNRGVARTDEREGQDLVKRKLEAQRATTATVEFESNCFDVRPGSVVTITNSVRADLEEKGLLVLETNASGTSDDPWQLTCLAMTADQPYRSPPKTQRPVAHGIDSATVVGPEGEEIWVDEFGRVQIQFHWDRYGKRDEKSSCWIHVSQGWAGTGYGSIMLPRVGQEVLVEYLGGDPDRPIIVGRVYTALEQVPYALPANKTQSGIKSNSTNKTGGYNEIMFEDAAGKELFRVQAEKDMNVLVKNNRTTTVKQNCSTSVGANRSINVTQNDSWTVGGSQNESITGSKTLTAGGPVTIKSTASSMHVEAYEQMETWANKMEISSDTLLTITAGNGMSQILMNDKAIIIDAPKVFVNPGSEEAIRYILENGEPPPVEDEPPANNVMDTIANIFRQGVDTAIELGRRGAEILGNNPSLIAGPLMAPIAPIVRSVSRATTPGNTSGSGDTPFSGGGGDFGGGGAGGSW